MYSRTIYRSLIRDFTGRGNMYHHWKQWGTNHKCCTYLYKKSLAKMFKKYKSIIYQNVVLNSFVESKQMILKLQNWRVVNIETRRAVSACHRNETTICTDRLFWLLPVTLIAHESRCLGRILYTYRLPCILVLQISNTNFISDNNQD